MDSRHPIKKLLPSKNAHSFHLENPPFPLTLFGETLNCPFATKEYFLEKLTKVCLPIVPHNVKMFRKKILRSDHEIYSCITFGQTAPLFLM